MRRQNLSLRSTDAWPWLPKFGQSRPLRTRLADLGPRAVLQRYSSGRCGSLVGSIDYFRSGLAHRRAGYPFRVGALMRYQSEARLAVGTAFSDRGGHRRPLAAPALAALDRRRRDSVRQRQAGPGHRIWSGRAWPMRGPHSRGCCARSFPFGRGPSAGSSPSSGAPMPAPILPGG